MTQLFERLFSGSSCPLRPAHPLRPKRPVETAVPAVFRRRFGRGSGRQPGCAALDDGRVLCWGRAGMLGNGVGPGSLAPVGVVGISNATAVTAGESYTCALRGSPGSVSCWGKNTDGQLGDGISPLDGTIWWADTPVDVVGLSDAVAVAAGTRHTCAIRDTGNVSCWGSNDSGGLGDGSPFDPMFPSRSRR